MDRLQLIGKIETAKSALEESFASLSEPQLVQPGVVGDWSVKDILAHVTAWEGEALKYLPLILLGGRLPRYSDMYGGIDAFNAQTTARNRALSLSEVLEGWAETHRRLVAYLQTVPEEQLTTETRFRRRVRLDTYSHYTEHTRMIREWRHRSAG